MASESKPIVIVTGANGGVGYGICQRLLIQLTSQIPSDSLPQDFEDASLSGRPQKYTGLTLIMACRSVSRAQKARTELLQFFDSHIQKIQSTAEYDGHAEEFKKNLSIEVEYVDLASIKTVLEFAKRVNQKYPYISHLMCNAGLASFSGLDPKLLLHQLFTDPKGAVTTPLYYSQHSGELSIDGLGWVWQCNVFSHFSMFRELQPSLSRSPNGPARVIWCSSIEASPKFYSPDDWQLRSTEHSYESSKYQIDLISTTLDRLALSSSSSSPNASNSAITRHFISQPGVCHTNVAHALVGPFLDFCKLMVFYFVRLLGSTQHPISPIKSAIASVHLALVPLTYLTFFSDAKTPPVRYGAESDRWGTERVGISPVRAWLANEGEGRRLVAKCDELLDKLKREEERGPVFETASEKM
ncbi:hypothetical protein H1R20_g9084, partial [Candolleomyces eurysporus]